MPSNRKVITCHSLRSRKLLGGSHSVHTTNILIATESVEIG